MAISIRRGLRASGFGIRNVSTPSAIEAQGGQEESLRHIAGRLGVSAERVRQLGSARSASWRPRRARIHGAG